MTGTTSGSAQDAADPQGGGLSAETGQAAGLSAGDGQDAGLSAGDGQDAGLSAGDGQAAGLSAGDGQSSDGRRRRDAAATRLALLEAARGRFIRLGYDRTTLRDVAADVGVNLALIKRYFDSKEGLFKAALASQPGFLRGEGEVPRDRGALAEALSRQLSADAWPEFAEHPVLMLLRVSGDERVDSLRRQALQDYSRKVLQASDPGLELDDDERLLRAQLVVALGVGVSIVRSAVGLQPLSDATSDDLVGPLREVVEVLLAPPQ